MNSHESDPLEQKKGELKAMIREALDDLSKESIKNEVVRDLTPADSKSSLAQFAQHPAFLLFISFALTGLFGTWISSRLQSREWDRQQDRLIRIKRAEQKYNFVEELTKAIAESNAAERDVLISFDPQWRVGDPSRQQTRNDRIKFFQEQGGRNWRINSALYRARLNTYFNDPKLVKAFDEIMNRRSDIGSRIGSLIDDFRKNNRVVTDAMFIADVESVNKLIDENRDALQEMIDVMVQKTQKDIEESL
jgi:hypothetical protein